MFQAFDSGGKQPLGPDEVLMVQGLVKEFCEAKSIDSGCPEAHAAAKDLLGWFQAGVTDKNRFRELLTSRD